MENQNISNETATLDAGNGTNEAPKTLHQQLLEAGVHFGHLKKKWNPKMLPYIFAEKNGIHIIDLQKTIEGMEEAAAALKQIAKSGKKIMFVATKKQAKEIVAEAAAKVGMPFVTERWLGGMLTNFSTIRKSVKKMQTIDKMLTDGTMDSVTKKERLTLTRSKDKLEKVLGGIATMGRAPSAVFMVDISHEHIALAESKRLGITMIVEILRQEFEHETAGTRRLLQAVPQSAIDYKPAPHSWTMGQLAQHIATIYHWYAGTLTQDVYDMATDVLERGDAADITATLDLFERNVLKAREALQSITDENLGSLWTMKHGERTVLGPMPRGAVARGFLFNHIYHHRGELVVYLRAAGHKVPGLYGPTYEDGQAAAQAK
jgi:ribosomal protein S2